MTPSWMEGLRILCRAENVFDRTGKTGSVFVKPDDIIASARRLYELEYFLEDISAIDTKEGLVAVYHFDHFINPGRVALHVIVSHESPVIPSISDIFSGAQWHERECHDFFGIRFAGHPDLKPLLVPDDLDYYPLIKEADATCSLDDLLDPGEIVDKDPAFNLFSDGPPGEQAREQSNPVKADSTHSGFGVES